MGGGDWERGLDWLTGWAKRGKSNCRSVSGRSHRGRGRCRVILSAVTFTDRMYSKHNMLDREQQHGRSDIIQAAIK